MTPSTLIIEPWTENNDHSSWLIGCVGDLRRFSDISAI